MRRVAAVALVFVSLSAGAADWSQWSAWQGADPEVRASSSFSARAGNATQRSAFASPGASGGATINAVRGFNGVWEASKSFPVSKAQVAAMGRAAARGLGWAGLAATGAQAVIDALSDGGVDWDPDQDTWVAPSVIGEFYYADYENDFDFTPANYLYQHRGEGWQAMIPVSRPCEWDAEAMGGGWVCAGDSSVIEWYSDSGHWKRTQYHIKKVSDGSYSGWRYSAYLQRTTAGCSGGEVALPGGGCGPAPDPVPAPRPPATDPEMEAAISDGIDQYPGSAPAIAQESAEAGAPIPITESPTWTGPSSVPGGTSSSSSSGPSGTTTEQSSITHHFSYGDPHPDAITVTDEETTTTTAPDGQQTVTTTTTTGEQVTGGDAGGTGTGSAAIGSNPCVTNPTASGCVPLGTVDDVELPSHDVAVDFAMDETAGSCPAPIVLPVMGQTHELSWQPVCDFATGTAPIVRAMAVLSAGLWVIFMFRRS